MSSLYKTNVDLLLIIPPSRIKHTIYPPYGAMYIASALRQKGYVKCADEISQQDITKLVEYYRELLNS